MNGPSRAFRLLLASLAVAGCAHVPPPRNDVFVNSATHVGQSVRVCGYRIDGANILESRRRRDWSHTGGLSIIERGPLPPLFRGRLCVEGTISRLGCETGPVVCVDAAFDFAISIRRVFSLEPGPEHGE